jgi:outer membrane receptor protein involved in Fe transport
MFAQDFWRVTQRFTLSLGARLDTWREFDGMSRTQSLVTRQVDVLTFPARSERGFSPRVAAVYRISDAVSAFASYARSFRAPSLNELYRAFRVGNVLTLANENLNAERADTFEAGGRIAGFSKRAVLRCNVFQTNVSDPVVSVTISSTPSLITRQRQNVGETRTRGLELDGEFIVADNLRVNLGYLLADSRVTESPLNPLLIGNFVPQVARHQLTLQAAYRPRRSVTISVQARASDAQYDDDLNTFRLRPYITVDGFAAYKFARWIEVFAAAENLFDRRYDIGLTPVRTIAAPRSVRAGFRFDLMRKD